MATDRRRPAVRAGARRTGDTTAGPIGRDSVPARLRRVVDEVLRYFRPESTSTVAIRAPDPSRCPLHLDALDRMARS